MTDKDEALRLALEALENITSVSICEATHHAKKDRHLLCEECPNEVRHLKAITAIKAALLSRSDGEAQTRSVVKDEPVAWRALNWGHSPDEYVYRDFDDPVMGIDGKPSPNNEPLYTKEKL